MKAKLTRLPDILSITAIVTVLYQLLFFFVAWTFRFDKVTDFAGGTNFIVLALLTLVLSRTFYIRQIITSAFTILWGIRLGGFLLYRIIKTEKDDRFDSIRDNFLSFAGFWIFQMIWVWTVSLPVVLGNSPRLSLPALGGSDAPFGSPTDIIGVVFFAVGLGIEAVSDQQKFDFRSKRTSPTDFMHSGVWAWSRHPNYFGEILLWWGIFLLSLQPTINGIGTNVAYAGVASPIFTTILLLFLSGLPRSEVPTAEKQWKKGNWVVYSAYLNETSILVPIPRFLYRPLPTFLKRTLLLDLPLYQFVPPTEQTGEDVSAPARNSKDGRQLV